MLEFFRMKDIEDIKKIEKYIMECDSHFSSLSLPNFLMWREAYPRECSIYNDTLIVREFDPEGEIGSYFFAPIGKDVEGAMKQVEEYCRENGQPLVWANLTEEEAVQFSAMYDCEEAAYAREWSEYIYRAEDMRTFKGAKFSGQRNHINKFKKLYGEYEYREITEENIPLVKEFLVEFGKNRQFATEDEVEEFNRTFELLDYLQQLDMVGGYIVANGEIVAMSLGEKKGDMLFVTVEKANRSYEGAYQVIVQEFAKHHTDEKIQYINREDDMGNEGLRKSKLQYKPIEIKHKYYIIPQTLFERIKPPVALQGERVLLDDITEADGEAFWRLSDDFENNKYWGYDCRTDEEYVSTAAYFLSFVRKMKDNREEYSLAVRVQGQLAGEAVFHNFDYHRGVELGVRILPEFQGQGLGAEAVACMAEYARSLGAETIRMKCFWENAASERMIRKAGFREICRDDTHIFFQLG